MALSKITNDGVATSGLPSGTVLQVKYTQFTSTNAVAISSSGNGTALADLTVNITPTSTSSIIMLTAGINGEFDSQTTQDVVAFFFRDSTKLAAPAAGNRPVGIQIGANISWHLENNLSTPEGFHYSYFDTPNTTSQITYKAGLQGTSSTNYRINATYLDADGTSHERGVSFIMAQEIAS